MSALPRIDRKQAKEAVQKHSLFFHGIAVPATEPPEQLVAYGKSMYTVNVLKSGKEIPWDAPQ